MVLTRGTMMGGHNQPNPEQDPDRDQPLDPDVEQPVQPVYDPVTGEPQTNPDQPDQPQE